ncbi:hypothetical protein [uncultured Parabacteroides sp.]|uniref:hypothetical protein n=1 Tax=uncultured Parabacteroides sp. TaxID=512312 RepID=UPI002623BF4F|nr:hypothetical protein [uncultured Parabacteroides sp.]
MKNRLNQYKRLPLLAGLFALIAFGCVSGEQGGNGDPDLPEMVEVDLQVGVSDVSGSLQTKASADDLKPLDGELIHSLVVFIVDASGKVEKKFQPDLKSDTKAQQGELTSWKSGSFKITGGAKRIYAFANWESLKDEPLKDIVATAEGDNMPMLPSTVSWESGINNILATKKFLPMSVQEEWVPANGVKPIYLVRLVSRLKVKMRNRTNHLITVTGLTVGEFNTTGSLFEVDKFVALSGNGYSIENLFKDEELAATDGSMESDWFYVNESETAGGFKVKLQTSSDVHPDNNPHQGEKFTALRQIPRNHVWNLNIEFTPYKLTLLSVSNENPPIGGYPESSTSNGITDLVCTVYGGGPFTITIDELVSQENNEGDISKQVDWSIGNVNKGDLLAEAPNSVTQNNTTGKWQITGGRMVGAATKEQSATFELIAKKGGVVLATFQIQLKFADIFDQAANP